MFKIDPNPTFWAAVAMPVPGQAKPSMVEMKFAHKTRAQLKDFLESLGDRTDEEALAEIVQDWRNVDAEFSRENLGRLLEHYPGAALALFRAYQSEVLEGRAKN
jgi:hypothetical protein